VGIFGSGPPMPFLSESSTKNSFSLCKKIILQLESYKNLVIFLSETLKSGTRKHILPTLQPFQKYPASSLPKTSSFEEELRDLGFLANFLQFASASCFKSNFGYLKLSQLCLRQLVGLLSLSLSLLSTISYLLDGER